MQLPRLGPGTHRETVTLPSGQVFRYTAVVPELGDGIPLGAALVLHYKGEVTPFFGAGLLEKLVQPGLAGLSALLVAPDSLGDDWLTAENEQALLEFWEAVRSTYEVPIERTVLTGFSMGGKGTWSLGGRHPELFAVAVPMAGNPEVTDLESWSLPVFAVHGELDELMPLAATKLAIRKLQARGLEARLEIAAGVSHFETSRHTEALREAVPWIQSRWQA